MNDMINLLFEKNAFWPIFSILAIVVFLTINALRKSNISRRLKSIKFLGNEIQLGDSESGTDTVDAKPELDSDVPSHRTVSVMQTIDKDLFANIIKNVIDETVDLATKRAAIKIDYTEKEKAFIKMKLSYITSLCINDYSLVVDVNSKDALIFEKAFDKDMKSIFIGRLESELNKNLNNKNDDEIKTIVDDVCTYAKSQMILYLSRYGISHGDEARKIFEKHLSDINSVIFECLVMIKTTQIDEAKLLESQEEQFNNKIDSLVKTTKTEIDNNRWWPDGK